MVVVYAVYERDTAKKEKENHLFRRNRPQDQWFDVRFSFIVIGLFLLVIPDYFGNELVWQNVRGLFIAIGGLGLLVEFEKVKSILSIRGLDDLWAGISLLAVWTALFFLTQNFLCTILGFFCLIFGVYGSFQGLIKAVYSIRLNLKSNGQSKNSTISDVLIFLT